MSGRGRGRGRGGGGAKTPFQAGSSMMGTLDFKDVIEANQFKEAILFPARNLPATEDVTQSEKRSSYYRESLRKSYRSSPYYLTVVPPKTATDQKYSDRYMAPPKKDTRFQGDAQRNKMHKEFFPTAIWEAYYEKKRKTKTTGKVKARKNAKDVELGDDAEADAEEEVDEEQDSEGPQDEYEDEQDGDDYENNYFDAGEEDEGYALGGGDNEAALNFD